jgi:hypothetical protein
MGTGLPLLSAQPPLRHAIGRRPLRTAPPRVQSNSAGEEAGVPVAGGGADPTRCSPTDRKRHFRVHRWSDTPSEGGGGGVWAFYGAGQ